ncbi:activin receptor type-2B-like [Halichondria panicea]|uniref:activin receptor type-2B-like n=1 Tax=Halichondria panicea TaxID=6063 RepID=UPI00312B9E06
MGLRVWTLVLSLLLVVLQTSTSSLTCWSSILCPGGAVWCQQQCSEGEACLANFNVHGPNDIRPLFSSCIPVLTDSCLNTRCDLTSFEGSGNHQCCCREDLCNALEGIVEGVTPPTQGTIATPSGTTPPIPNNGNIVCESYSEVEHIYKTCSVCTTTYKLIAGDDYQLDTKRCLDSPPVGITCTTDSCSLNTSGSNVEISCCCSSYLCNAYSELTFSDVTRVSNYVHITPCDSSACTHSCVVVDGSPTCFCQDGHTLEADGVSCTDIDECSMNPCSYRCQNTIGSFHCTCPLGSRIMEDGVTCEEPGLVCYTNDERLLGFQYCQDDLMETDSAIPECHVIYRLLENGIFVLELAGCFAKDETNSCRPTTINEPCVLTQVGQTTRYECCCTHYFCNSEQNIDFSTVSNSTVSIAPTTITTTNSTTDVILSTTFEPLSSTMIGLIVVGLFIGILVFVICLIIVVYCFVSKKRKISICEVARIANSEPIEASHAHDINLLNEIGRGRFAVVHYAQMRGSDVAVKCFDVKESFTKEVAIYLLNLFHHPNVLKFLTFVENTEEKNYWIVFEYHEKGSLYSLVQRKAVTLKEFCALSESIACGLAFLHSEFTIEGVTKPCVVHRDLKSKNILVKSDGKCAISDFGLSVRFPLSEQDGHGQVGTSRYMAPEVLEGCITFNRAAYKQIDCYSVGVIFYEIMTRTELNGEAVPDYRPPFDGEVPEHPTIEDMRNVVAVNGHRPPFPDRFNIDGSFDTLTEMITELWDTYPEARLTAEAIFRGLTNFRLSKFPDDKAIDSGYENEIPSTPSSSILAASPSPFTLKHPGVGSSLLGYSTSYTGNTTETTV